MPDSKSDHLFRPYLKWAGGKRQLLPEIREHLPSDIDGLRYFEPFVGAGALFFDMLPISAEINDYNVDLMHTYTVIRDHIDELITALRLHRELNSEEHYYFVRELDRNKETYGALTVVQRAARLIYLNKTCYNGLYRVNAQGMFNVPYGRYINPAICDEPLLRSIHDYMNREDVDIDISCGDFAAAVENAGHGAFIYFDPPYHSADNTNFTGYQAGGFNDGEQLRLRDVFSARTDAGAKCLLSNSDTPFIREIYSDERYEIIPVKAKRAINSNGAGRGEVDEVIIKNWR